MQSLVRSAAAVRHARRFLAVIEPITLRAPFEARRSIFSGFGSPWWTESDRTFCCGPHHQGDLRSVTGDSNVLEDGHFAGTVKKETLTTNNNNKKKKKKKKKADDAALFISFEQWMAEYGKVYSTEAEKARRFKYFKETIVHGGLGLYEFAADSPREKKKKEEEADDAALFRSFEQWMADYGKVYPTEAEKARRFKYFKCSIGYNEYSADSPKKRGWPGQHQECYMSLSRLDEDFFG